MVVDGSVSRPLPNQPPIRLRMLACFLLPSLSLSLLLCFLASSRALIAGRLAHGCTPQTALSSLSGAKRRASGLNTSWLITVKNSRSRPPAS
jgi:hypothetical protein